MKPARQAVVVVWSLNTLLGLGILAYAGVAFLVARPDPLADLPAPAGRAKIEPYRRNVEALKSMGMVKKADAAVVAPSVDLTTFVTVVTIGRETAKLHVLNDSTRQIWVNLGEDLHSKLLGHFPTAPDPRTKDIGPTRGWVLEKLEPRAAFFRRGDEVQRLGVAAAGMAGLVTADLGTLLKKPYKAADYKTTYSGNGYMMDPKEIDWAIANREDLLNSLALRPVDGALSFASVPEILAARGFLAGDALTNINGRAIRGMEDLRSVIDANSANFAGGGVFTVTLVRAGGPVSLRFTVPAPTGKGKAP